MEDMRSAYKFFGGEIWGKTQT